VPEGVKRVHRQFQTALARAEGYLGSRTPRSIGLVANAAAIVLVHNHPSGDPTPSPEDAALTREIVKAGELLGVDVLDHIVVGKGKFVSLKERGLGF